MTLARLLVDDAAIVDSNGLCIRFLNAEKQNEVSIGGCPCSIAVAQSALRFDFDLHLAPLEVDLLKSVISPDVIKKLLIVSPFDSVVLRWPFLSFSILDVLSEGLGSS